MNVEETHIPGVVIVEPAVYADERGAFFEAWNDDAFRRAGIEETWVQDNQSISREGVLRGLHYQIGGRPQAKLVRCLEGAVFDVVVDLRRGSPTFGQYAGVILDDVRHRWLYVPRGLAHGFLVLTPSAKVTYKVSDYWSRDDERGLLWCCPEANVVWPAIPGGRPLLNDRDWRFPALSQIPVDDLPVFEDTKPISH